MDKILTKQKVETLKERCRSFQCKVDMINHFQEFMCNMIIAIGISAITFMITIIFLPVEVLIKPTKLWYLIAAIVLMVFLAIYALLDYVMKAMKNKSTEAFKELVDFLAENKINAIGFLKFCDDSIFKKIIVLESLTFFKMNEGYQLIVKMQFCPERMVYFKNIKEVKEIFCM